MENFNLISISIHQNNTEEAIQFQTASLHVHTEDDDYRSWYVDISSLESTPFLEQIFNSSDIQIYMQVKTNEGHKLEGDGFIHPNLAGHNATIRGNGELIGYQELDL